MVDGRVTCIRLQASPRPVIGPLPSQLVAREGDVGEGNFRALRESIEQDRIERGVPDAAA